MNKKDVKEIAKSVAQDVVTGLAITAVCYVIGKVSGINLGGGAVVEEKETFLAKALKRNKRK